MPWCNNVHEEWMRKLSSDRVDEQNNTLSIITTVLMLMNARNEASELQRIGAIPIIARLATERASCDAAMTVLHIIFSNITCIDKDVASVVKHLEIVKKLNTRHSDAATTLIAKVEPAKQSSSVADLFRKMCGY